MLPLLTGENTDGDTAFEITIDRIGGPAQIDPSEKLLEHCSILPPRPTLANPYPESCIIRRDVQSRTYPARQGGFITAMEITPQVCRVWPVLAKIVFVV